MNTRSVLNTILAIAILSIGILPVSAQEYKHAFHGSKTAGGFHIELTVEPLPIEPGNLTRFGTVFRDNITGELAKEVPHTFILKKDGMIIFKESTNVSSTLHEFNFTEEHKGPLSVLIENINNSGESVEFSLTVVPEFTLNVILVTSIMISIMFVTLRMKGKRSNQYNI